MRERELLQLVVERVEPQAVGDRRVDLHRLARDAAALRGRHRAEGAHVVQPVGELDQHDAHIARHREQHLAEVLGLRILGRLELDAVELRDAVDQLGHRLAERIGDLVLGDRGVLGDVVEEGRHQRLPVEVPVGQDLRDRERVRDVGVAGLPRLAVVRRLREAVGLGKPSHVLRLQVSEAARVEELGGGSPWGQITRPR